MQKDNKRMDLVDMLCIFQEHIESKFPASWVSFAVDVIELYNKRGQFVEDTAQAVMFMCPSCGCMIQLLQVPFIWTMHESQHSIYIYIYRDTYTYEFIPERLHTRVLHMYMLIRCFISLGGP